MPRSGNSGGEDVEVRDVLILLLVFAFLLALGWFKVFSILLRGGVING